MSASDRAESHMKKGFQYLNAQDFGAAARELAEAAELQPHCGNYSSNLATCYHLAADWDKADQAWTTHLQQHPDDVDAKSNYAVALTKQAKANPKQGAVYLQKAAELMPRSSSHHTAIAKAYYNAKDWAKAAGHFNEANEYITDPGSEPTLEAARALNKEWIGSCFDNLGEFGKASQLWRECLNERSWPASSRQGIESDLERVKRLAGMSENKRTRGSTNL